MTTLQIAVASADAFVILLASGVISNLLAGWLARWWFGRRRIVMHLRHGETLGIVRAPMPGGRCDHLRERELCDDCKAQ